MSPREEALLAQVDDLTTRLERETIRSTKLAAQVKEKTKMHGQLVCASLCHALSPVI